MKVKHISQDNKGAFIAYIDDQQAGMMTYSVAGEDKIIADHTEVEDNFRMRGVGEELFKALIEHVKTNNIKVIPICPFVKSRFEKDESLAIWLIKKVKSTLVDKK
ncbi:MAG: N-acetyltransferase [Erysipelothrix sp.]|nr:N-acetyltransferase [Erysipelothrix sp.]